MEMHMKRFLGGVAVAGLSACGGSSGDVVLGPGDVVDGTVAISYDPDTAAVTLNGNSVVDPRDTLLATKGDARLFASGVPTHRSALAENTDAYAIVVATDNLAPEFVGAAYGRRDETVLPDGSATFSGDYAGLTVFQRPSNNDLITSMLTGDVAMTVDFDDSSLSGSITNREVLRPTGVDFAAYDADDVIISGGTIAANGTFTAATSGGAFISALAGETWSTGAGTASGVLAGADGETAAGILRILHTETVGGDDFAEVGAFIATAD